MATVASQLGITVSQVKNIMNLDADAQVQALSGLGTVTTLVRDRSTDVETMINYSQIYNWGFGGGNSYHQELFHQTLGADSILVSDVSAPETSESSLSSTPTISIQDPLEAIRWQENNVSPAIEWNDLAESESKGQGKEVQGLKIKAVELNGAKAEKNKKMAQEDLIQELVTQVI
jgi:hypothetical protein